MATYNGYGATPYNGFGASQPQQQPVGMASSPLPWMDPTAAPGGMGSTSPSSLPPPEYDQAMLHSLPQIGGHPGYENIAAIGEGLRYGMMANQARQDMLARRQATSSAMGAYADALIPPGMAGPPPAAPSAGGMGATNPANAPRTPTQAPVATVNPANPRLGQTPTPANAPGTAPTPQNGQSAPAAQSIPQAQQPASATQSSATQPFNLDALREQETQRIYGQMRAARLLMANPDTADRGAQQLASLSQQLNPVAMEQQLAAVAQSRVATGAKLQMISDPTTGMQLPYWVDELNKTFTPAMGPNGTQIGSFSTNPDMHGDEYLQTLDPHFAMKVQRLVSGKDPYPSGMAAKLPQNIALVNAAQQYDPQFNFYTAHQRADTQKAFTSGPESNNIKAINTAIGHLGDLSDDVEGLNNTSVPTLNWAINGIQGEFDPNLSAKLGSFNLNKQLALREVANAFANGDAGVTEAQELNKRITTSASPEELHAVIAKAVHMLDSRLDALHDKYKQGTGGSIDEIRMLSEKADATRSKLLGIASGGGSGAQSQSDGSADMPLFNSPDELKAAIASGKFQSGQKFRTPQGEIRTAH